MDTEKAFDKLSVVNFKDFTMMYIKSKLTVKSITQEDGFTKTFKKNFTIIMIDMTFPYARVKSIAQALGVRCI